jgi:hypothetical protein
MWMDDKFYGIPPLAGTEFNEKTILFANEPPNLRALKLSIAMLKTDLSKWSSQCWCYRYQNQNQYSAGRLKIQQYCLVKCCEAATCYSDFGKRKF